MKKFIIGLCLLFGLVGSIYGEFKYRQVAGSYWSECQVVFFREYGGILLFEDKIQNFCKGKEILKIQMTESKNQVTVMIVYR
jgi:hypothetical protein